MNRLLFLSTVAVMPVASYAVSLDECLKMAHDNYPAIRQYEMLDQSREFTLDNAAKGWLPQVSATAGAFAFTDIVKSSQKMTKMGLDMKNYMASASVTVSQNVYDGGQISAQKRVASAQTEVQKRQLDVTMYAVNERVEQIYFGILLLDEQIRQTDLLKEDLQVSERNIRSMIKGGIANQSDLDKILVENVKADQQKEALAASRSAYLRMLATLIGKELADTEHLEKPSATAVPSREAWGNNRPEMLYYASQNKLLDEQRNQLNSRLRPKVSLFGMGMIHSKVTDMMNNGILAGGISLSWNIGALYTRKNDLRKLETQRAMNESQRDVFLFNNRLQNEDAGGSVASLRRQIEQDDEIVRLRESIRSKSDRKVQMGTESVNELVGDINAVSMARLQKAQHEIQLLKEIYRIKNLNNE